jgi:hypothetical protein
MGDNASGIWLGGKNRRCKTPNEDTREHDWHSFGHGNALNGSSSSRSLAVRE